MAPMNHDDQLIFETLRGDRTAAEQLGISEAHFHRLRERAVQGAVEALEAQPRGRPRTEPEPVAAERVTDLEQQVSDLELELLTSNLREELALVMPHVLQSMPEEARKKKNERKRKRKRRRKAR